MRSLQLLALSTICILANGFVWGADSAKSLPPVPMDDAVKLVKAGLSEEVQMAWAESLPPYAQVDTDTILKLKENKISEKVIATLIRRGGARSSEIQEVARYEVPSISRSKAARDYLSKADTEQADVREAYTQDDAVQYRYVQPTRTVYVNSGYSYPASYAYYSSYPYYSGYYNSSYRYPYRCYPSSYYPYRSSFSFGFGIGFGGHSHYRGGYSRCR